MLILNMNVRVATADALRLTKEQVRIRDDSRSDDWIHAMTSRIREGEEPQILTAVASDRILPGNGGEKRTDGSDA